MNRATAERARRRRRVQRDLRSELKRLDAIDGGYPEPVPRGWPEGYFDRNPRPSLRDRVDELESDVEDIVGRPGTPNLDEIGGTLQELDNRISELETN